MAKTQTGESTAAIYRRADIASWKTRVLPAMKAGARLGRYPKLTAYYTRHENAELAGQGGLQPAFVQQLERDGVIELVGVQTYALTAAARAAPSCRVCGCTDYMACAKRCYWVEPDLCSSCGEGTLLGGFHV